MSDPRDVETALDAKGSQPVEATDDGGDSSSSGQVIGEAPERDLNPPPDRPAENVAQAAGDRVSSLSPGAPALDPSAAAGFDPRLDASAAFEDWSARAVDPGLGLAGGLGGLPDPGAQLDGLTGGSAFHTPGLPGLDRSRDPGSLLDGTSPSDAALNQAAQAGLDSGPQVGQSGGMSDYASGDTVTFNPVVTRDAAGSVFTSTTTNTYGFGERTPGSVLDDSAYQLLHTTTTTTTEPTGGTPAEDEPPDEEPPATTPPAPADDDDGTDDDDDTGMTTGEDGTRSPRTQAALDFLGVPEATISRAGTAGPDFGHGDPGDDGDTGGGTVDQAPGGTEPRTQEPRTTGEGGPIIFDPGDRPPTAGPEYVRGDPGGNGLDGGGPVTAGGGADDPMTVGMATGGARAGATLDAGASTGDMSAGQGPGTISGQEDDDLEDLEAQRDNLPGGGTRAATSSAAGDAFGASGAAGLAGSATDAGIIIPDFDRQAPSLADDFSASVMGGLDAPVETSGIQAAPAESMDLATAVPAVVEAGLPPMGSAEDKLRPVAGDDATAGGSDLSEQEAAFEVAPAAFEAPQMDQPALEQVDPGLAANEPPPDESGMGPMDGPLP